ncbi:hypothetical protein P9439_22890, partial [Escherichia coli]|uniref:hypothetical protein n=1 Tax=Escherichia coli TaxID=562 RepID=UPI00372E5495
IILIRDKSFLSFVDHDIESSFDIVSVKEYSLFCFFLSGAKSAVNLFLFGSLKRVLYICL